MTGIAGIVGCSNAETAQRLVKSMVACMRHSDDLVVKVLSSPEANACVASCCLPGSFSSRASGVSSDGLMLAFSGELFPVEKADTVVSEDNLWDSFRERSVSAVVEFNGLFSGALVDPKRKQVALFNDRYGSERIYVHEKDSILYFSSEAKALLAVLPELRVWDYDGVTQYLTFGSTFDRKTLFSGVSTMPGGSLWKYQNGRKVSEDRYFKPDQWEAQTPLSKSAFEETYLETAKAVFPNYYRSDTKIGLSLTGGLDTRMILATLTEQDTSLVGYTYAAEDSDTLDVQIARKISGLLDLDYQVLRLNNAFVKDYSTFVDRSIYLTDGTIGATGAHELYFTELAQAISSIRLTGNFGSELLRSMSTYKKIDLRSDVLSSDFSRAVDECASVDSDLSHPLTHTAFGEIPEHLFGPVALARSFVTFRTPYLDNAIVKLAYRAPPSSRSSPSTALRLIAEGPSGLGNIPTDLGYSCNTQSNALGLQRLLYRLTFKMDYWDKDGLPSSLSRFGVGRKIVQRSGLLGWHKFLPYRRWFRCELSDYLRDVFDSEDVRTQPWWEQNELEAMLDAHFSGRRNCIREINAVVTLSSIQRQFF
jgi:asparagine synthase (glutamine-hydrolysing)